MRYININHVRDDIPAAVIARLQGRHQEVVDGDDPTKEDVIGKGNTTWRQVKVTLENASNRKCWYTESKNPGCLNDVEHYRPKGRKVDKNGVVQYWYWFLAFDPENYRLSCHFPNRLNNNPETGLTGGKGDSFPLLGSQRHATAKTEITQESPVLLDPCSEDDCELLEFQPDGRPVVSSSRRDDPVACLRVEQSKLLLNLDFPTFNEDRENLYNKIKNLVERGDNYGVGNPALEDVKQDLRELIDVDSPYSKAAECYLRCFRDREWVEQLVIDTLSLETNQAAA